MPQDSNSGAEANRRGRFVGLKVGEFLGIELKKGSNEGYYKGNNSVIKYAGYRTTRFGITNAMLPRLSQVILAKETNISDKYELYLIKIDKIVNGTPSRSQGSQDRTTMFQVSTAIKNGYLVGEFQIADA